MLIDAGCIELAARSSATQHEIKGETRIVFSSDVPARPALSFGRSYVVRCMLFLHAHLALFLVTAATKAYANAIAIWKKNAVTERATHSKTDRRPVAPEIPHVLI
jgi:hypothetical protein